MSNKQARMSLWIDHIVTSWAGQYARPLLMFSLLTIALWLASAAQAQTMPVTDDDVAAIAERMYCPICENEPLDDCRAQTCIEWKQEIREQLEAGRTPDQIINDFVSRYGQHVVGVPTDPTLIFLSFIIPFIGTVVIVAAGVLTFWRWRRNNKPYTATVTTANTSPNAPQDAYRSQVERDLLS